MLLELKRKIAEDEPPEDMHRLVESFLDWTHAIHETADLSSIMVGTWKTEKKVIPEVRYIADVFAAMAQVDTWIDKSGPEEALHYAGYALDVHLALWATEMSYQFMEAAWETTYKSDPDWKSKDRVVRIMARETFMQTTATEIRGLLHAVVAKMVLDYDFRQVSVEKRHVRGRLVAESKPSDSKLVKRPRGFVGKAAA